MYSNYDDGKFQVAKGACKNAQRIAGIPRTKGLEDRII